MLSGKKVRGEKGMFYILNGKCHRRGWITNKTATYSIGQNGQNILNCIPHYYIHLAQKNITFSVKLFSIHSATSSPDITHPFIVFFFSCSNMYEGDFKFKKVALLLHDIFSSEIQTSKIINPSD